MSKIIFSKEDIEKLKNNRNVLNVVNVQQHVLFIDDLLGKEDTQIRLL